MSSFLFDSSFKFKNWMNVNNVSLFASKDSSLISPIYVLQIIFISMYFMLIIF